MQWSKKKNRRKKQQLLDSLKEGQVVEGTVQRITNFGVFVDLGGIDGLVHISQLAHEHVEKASDIVSEGEKIKVEILAVDRDNERISLSRKNTLPGPWTDIENRISRGDIVESTVKRLGKFWSICRDFPWSGRACTYLANCQPACRNSTGSTGSRRTRKVKVLDVNEAEKRISLSIKEVEAEEEKQEYKQYEKQKSPGFHLGELIGDKLEKYKK